MAKMRGPILKRCKKLGISPAVLGIHKETNRNPGSARRKQSEYGIQLNEKQKVKFIYGVLEKQFRKYYEKAEKAQGVTGHNMLRMLELRLDNVVFRLGFADSRREARQLVNHGHFLVNGNKVDIPSYSVKVGDVISVREKSQSTTKFKTLIETRGSQPTPAWIDRAKDSYEGKVIALPERDQIDYEVDETLIVEFYSK